MRALDHGQHPAAGAAESHSGAGHGPPAVGIGMPEDRAAGRARLGFRDGDKGTHSSRTLMLAELEALLAETPPTAEMPAFRKAVVEDNILGKRSETTREHTVRKLKALYGLDPGVPVYRLMRRFWSVDEPGRPLLALLCAVARDPLLRASVDVVLDARVGDPVPNDALATTVRPTFSDSTRAAIVSHLASTWGQAGYLTTTKERLRTKPVATPGTAAYGLALGYMEGLRGTLLLSTMWMRLLDVGQDRALELVQRAARQGWVTYRAAGDVVDLRVEELFTEEERGVCDGQSR